MRRTLLLLSIAVLASCSSPPAAPGSLRVQVNVEPGIASRCARLIARGTSQRDSSPVVLTGKTSFVVGVAQENEGLEVTLQAQGYSDEGCQTLTVPAEISEAVATRFTSPTTAVMLTLRSSSQPRPDGGVDGDGDGFGPALDCDDTNAAIFPEAIESCVNGLDDDCNGLSDCAEASCADKQCQAGAGNQCRGQVCAEDACNDNQDNDGDGRIDCADSDCAAQACGMSGQCRSGVCVAPSEAGLCADNLDNDGDGDIDCADADCPQGKACSDSNACTQNDECNAGRCAGTQLVCNQPPSEQCFASSGQCVPGGPGVCTYAVRTGSCDDGLACTQNDTCAADGRCAGTPRRCDSPPSGGCFSAAGQCSEAQGGTCVYPPRTGSCDDQDSCTVNDRCEADGDCAGTRVTCTPPGECFVAGACAANGGCLFSVRSGSCTGGTCSAAGVCVPAVTVPAFPYTPSNFNPAQLPPSAGALVASCDITIDTHASGGGLGWTTCPGGPAAPPSSVVSGAMLLHFDQLTINSGVTVRAIGARPLIIGVRGAVMINGTLSVNSSGSQGAGSELACGSGVGGDGRVSGNPQNGGGGGGGGFATRGGKGSEGDHGGEEGERGDANGNSSLTPLRGGCRGGAGGRSSPGSGVGGRGGGAVQVSAGGILTVSAGGTVSSQGEGGRGGLAGQRTGGGGGGSGGALFLEASTLVIHAGAAVVANGGAGGEGSGSSSNGADGQSGQRSTSRSWAYSLTCGGNGGTGGALEEEPGHAREPNCDDDMPGGGGGGSVGRIRFNAINGCQVSNWATISPEPSSSQNCN